MLNVVEERHPGRILAAIGYAFDRDDPNPGPYLDPLNEQSRYAPALMELVSELALSDSKYLARLERHYRLVKAAAADPHHPAYATLQEAIAGEPDTLLEYLSSVDPARNLNASSKRPGRNAPCPCGSGKKYKYCCGRRR
jgi:preprotein translocase subunit SecA